MDLTNSRAIGYGEGPISWPTIHIYCEANEIVGEQREDVFFQVQQLDSVYLDYKAKKAKAASKTGAGKTKLRGK